MSAFPQIVINQGKYSNEYYIANDYNDLLKAYLDIIDNWVDYSYINLDVPEELELDAYDAEIFNMTPDQIDALPEVYRHETNQRLERIKRRFRSHRQELQRIRLVKSLVEAESVDAALKMTVENSSANAIRSVIMEYSGNEYMTVTTVNPVPLGD